MNFRDIPICESLQALAEEDSLPDGVYLTRIMSSVRKVVIVEGMVSLYGGERKFNNRFMQSDFFSVNVVLSKLNNKKWKQKSKILEAEKMYKKIYETTDL